jgi:hypothetical protein
MKRKRTLVRIASNPFWLPSAMTTQSPTPPPFAKPPTESAALQRWQFSLRELMALMLVLSLYFGATAWFGWPVGIFGSLGLALYVPWYVHRRIVAFCIVEFYAAIALIALLAGLLMPAISKASVDECRPSNSAPASSTARR